MKKIDKILKQLSDLYEFNRKIKTFEFKRKDKVKEALKPPGNPPLPPP